MSPELRETLGRHKLMRCGSPCGKQFMVDALAEARPRKSGVFAHINTVSGVRKQKRRGDQTRPASANFLWWSTLSLTFLSISFHNIVAINCDDKFKATKLLSYVSDTAYQRLFDGGLPTIENLSCNFCSVYGDQMLPMEYEAQLMRTRLRRMTQCAVLHSN